MSRKRKNQVGSDSKNRWFVIHTNHPNVDDLSIMWYIVQIWMIYVCCCLIWMFCIIHFWMILSMLVNHLKLDVLYNPLLYDSEHACKSSKGGCLYNPLPRNCIGCSKGYSQKWIKGINFQINEQANSGLQKIRGQLAYMSVENFRIHCSLFLALKNMDKKFGLSLHALHL